MGLSKEHDWVMETLYNPTFSNTDFKTVGINTSNTSIAPLDVYLKLPEIQKMPLFQTDGQFDATKVLLYYYKALQSYNNLAKDTYEQDLDMNLDAIFASNNFFAPPLKRMKGPLVSLTFLDNPTRQTFGVVEINTPGKQYKTIEEIAQSNQIWDSNTNSFTKETPEESFFKNFFRPMALAVWEYDADANGNRTSDPSKVVYHLGDMKLHNGEPYYEFLNGKSGYGRLILSKMNILTKEDSWLNQFDFFDSDDAEKSVAGSLALNIAKVVPMFIPYVGEAYMYTSLALAGTEALATIGKMFTGSDNVALNETTSFLSSLHTGVSDYGKQHAFSMENVLNMVGDTFQFIKSQRLLAEQAPRWFKGKMLTEDEAAVKVERLALEATDAQIKGMRIPVTEAEKLAAAKTLTDLNAVNVDKYRRIVLLEIENYQKLGQAISTNYMAITFGTHTYEAAKAEGVEDLPATLLTLGAIAGQYALLNSHIGQWVFPESGVQAQQRKKALELFPLFFNKEVVEVMNDGAEKAANTVQKITFAERMWNKGKDFANKVYSTPIQTTAQAAITGGIASGVEMMSFSVLDDVIGQVYNTAQWISGNPHRMHPWENMFERYATSFLGGGVAGLMAIPKLKDAAKQIHEMTPDLAYKWVVSAVADGKGDELIKEVDKVKWAPSDLSAEKYVDTPDGERLYQMGTIEDNQNHFIREGVKNEIRLIGNILDAHNAKVGANALLTNDIRGPLKIAQVGRSSMVQKYVSDYYDTLVDIVRTSKEIGKIPDASERKQEKDIQEAERKYKELLKKYEETKKADDKKAAEEAKNNYENLNTLSTKRKHLSELLDRKNKFLNGEYEAEYKKMALYEMSIGINLPFINLSFYPYVEKLYGKPFKEFSDEEIAKSIVEYTKYKNNNADYIETSFKEVFEPTNKLVSDYLKDIKTKDISKGIDVSNTKLLKLIVGSTRGDLLTLLTFKIKPKGNDLKDAETFYDKTTLAIVSHMYKSIRGTLPENIDPELALAVNDVETLLADLNTKLILTNNEINKLLLDEDLAKPLQDAIIRDTVKYRLSLSDAIRTLESLLYSGRAASMLEEELDNIKIITPTLYTKLHSVINDITLYRDPLSIKAVVRKFDSDYNLVDTILEIIPELYKDSILKLLEVLVADTDEVEDNKHYAYYNLYSKLYAVDSLLQKLKDLPLFDLIDTINEFGKKVTLGKFDFMNIYKVFSDTFISNSGDLEQYLIGRSDLNNIDVAIKILQAFRSGVIASNDVVRELDNIFGYNPTVNSLMQNKELTVLPESDVVLLTDYINLLEEQLTFFENLTYAAGASKFRDVIKIDNDVMFNLYTTVTKKLENIPDSWNGKLELIADIKNIKDLPDLIKAGSRDLNQQQLNQAYEGLIKFEKLIYDFGLKNLDKINNVDELGKFLDIFDCFKEHSKVEAIGDKADFSDENAYMFYIASLFAMDPELFYSNLPNAMLNNLAPTVVQQVGVRSALAYCFDNTIFDTFTEAYNLKMDKITGLKNSEYHIAFDKFFLVEAGPGAGKSSGILPFYISFLKILDKSKLKNIWFASTQPKDKPNDTTSAKSIRRKSNIKEDEGQVFTKQSLMTYLCGNYTAKVTEDNVLDLKESDLNFNEDTGVATYANNKLREDLDKDELPKVLIIDECSDYSDLDFRIIKEFALKYDVKVLLLGDLRQVALRGKVKFKNGDSYVLNLARTLFARTFLNNTSFRTNNTLLDYNFLMDRTLLLPANINTNKVITYKYYTDDTGLYGRYVELLSNIKEETKRNIDLMLKTLSKDENGVEEKIGFVYDSEEGGIYKYIQSLPNELISKFEFHKNLPIKGVEAKYYIVELSPDTTTAESFENAKSVLYTAFSRAIQGNIVHMNLGGVTFASKKLQSNGLLRSPTEAIASYNALMKDFLTKLYPEAKKLNISNNTAEPKATNTSNGNAGNNNDDSNKDDSNKDDSKENSQDDILAKVNSNEESNTGNVFNPVIPSNLDAYINKLNETTRNPLFDIIKGRTITIQKVGGGKDSTIEVNPEEFIWELYTSFNNFTGLIEDERLGFKESRLSGERFDNYYGLRRIIELYNGNNDYILSDDVSDSKVKSKNVSKKLDVAALLLELRELIWYTKDFDTLEDKLKSVLLDRLGLKEKFKDFYIRFVWESARHFNTDGDAEESLNRYDGEKSLARSKEEKLDGIDGTAKDKDKISAKGLALHIGAKIVDKDSPIDDNSGKEHDTVLLSIPFANLPNPFTILGLLESRVNTPKGKKYEWVKKYFTKEFTLNIPDPYSRLGEIMMDLEKSIRQKATNKNYEIPAGQISLYYLIRTYLYNDNAYTPIVSPKTKGLFDVKWTPASHFNTTSPYIISSERGVNYEYALPRGFVDFTVNKEKVQYITVKDLQNNPTLSVSNIYITTHDVLSSDGKNIVIKKGNPFVLVGSTTDLNGRVLRETNLFEQFEKLILSKDTPNLVSVVYVRQPRATIDEYLNLVKNLSMGIKPTDPKIFIGNDFTSYRLLLILNAKRPDGKTYLEEIREAILNTETFDKYNDKFKEFLKKLEERLPKGKTLESLDNYDNEAFKIAVKLLREPSGLRTERNSSLTYALILNNVVTNLLRPKWLKVNLKEEGGIATTLYERMLRDIPNMWKQRYGEDTIPYNVNFDTSTTPHFLNKVGVYNVTVDSESKFAGKPYSVNIVRTPIMEGDIFPLLAATGFSINNGHPYENEASGWSKSRASDSYYIPLNNSGLSIPDGKTPSGGVAYRPIDLIAEGIRMPKSMRESGKKPKVKVDPDGKPVKEFEIDNDHLTKTLGLDSEATLNDIILKSTEEGYVYIKRENITYFSDKKLPNYTNHRIKAIEFLSDTEVRVTMEEKVDNPTITELIIRFDFNNNTMNVENERIIRKPEVKVNPGNVSPITDELLLQIQNHINAYNSENDAELSIKLLIENPSDIRVKSVLKAVLPEELIEPFMKLRQLRKEEVERQRLEEERQRAIDDFKNSSMCDNDNEVPF